MLFSVFNSPILALTWIKILEEKFMLPVISLLEMMGNCLLTGYIFLALMLKLLPNIFKPLNWALSIWKLVPSDPIFKSLVSTRTLLLKLSPVGDA